MEGKAVLITNFNWLDLEEEILKIFPDVRATVWIDYYLIITDEGAIIETAKRFETDWKVTSVSFEDPNQLYVGVKRVAISW